MQSAQMRSNEAATLTALHGLEILDTAPEPEFDALVHAAATVCGVPMSLISLVDLERQWFKANIGLSGTSQTAREISFCAHAVLSDSVLVVEDTTKDSRFAGNPFVLGEPRIRFYAGAPLRLSSGERIGTLCVMDSAPRFLFEAERSALERLAVAVVRALEGRQAIQALHRGRSSTPEAFAVQSSVDRALRNVDHAMKHLFTADVGDRAKQNAMHFCLTSTVALLGITHKLLDPDEPLTPLQREAAWKQLSEDSKVAGRSAYRAALALADPHADPALAAPTDARRVDWK
ncbi:MAG: GAF domain-containing protein [Variovorax sp.]|nr:MAG: GAF domain-containing protein [Variovorax sp.]